jgi:hypothetical protein
MHFMSVLYSLPCTRGSYKWEPHSTLVARCPLRCCLLPPPYSHHIKVIQIISNIQFCFLSSRLSQLELPQRLPGLNQNTTEHNLKHRRALTQHHIALLKNRSDKSRNDKNRREKVFHVMFWDVMRDSCRPRFCWILLASLSLSCSHVPVLLFLIIPFHSPGIVSCAVAMSSIGNIKLVWHSRDSSVFGSPISECGSFVDEHIRRGGISQL